MTPLNNAPSSLHSQQVTSTQVTPNQGSTGSSNLPSSASQLTSAAPEESKGFLSKIADCVAVAMNAIRRVLARLPWVGFYFEIEHPSEDETISSNGSSSLTLTDAEIVHMIEEAFKPFSDQAPLRNDLVDASVEQFRTIESQTAKMQAFKAVISSDLSSQEMITRFYQALPVEMQNAFKEEIFKANHYCDHFDDRSHGLGFGDYMIHHRCKHRVVQDAVKNYCAHLGSISR